MKAVTMTGRDSPQNVLIMQSKSAPEPASFEKVYNRSLNSNTTIIERKKLFLKSAIDVYIEQQP